MSRVRYREGSEPFLIIAPHGVYADDANTDIVADRMAAHLDGYAVINTGWSRSKKFSFDTSYANLNNLRHCPPNSPTLKEFLEPIVNFKDAIVAKHGICYVYLIHGMSAKIQARAQDDVQVVVGFGQGDPPSYSCDLSHKNLFVHFMQQYGLNIYQAKVGGRFSAWQKNNVNQFFRQWSLDMRVQSLQLELVPSMRMVPKVASESGEALGGAAERASWRMCKLSSDFFIREI